MRRLVMLLFLGSTLGGCFGGDPGPATTDNNGVLGGDDRWLIVAITNHTQKIMPSTQEVDVTWQVAYNGTNASFTITNTAVHWADRSHAEPTPISYGNVSGLTENETGPKDFSVSFIPKSTNSTSLYVRPHAVVAGEWVWGAEVNITFEYEKPPPAQPPAPSVNQTYTVEIGANVPGAVADYDPVSVTIKTGDFVQWKNVDATAHTATERVNGAWTTGSIPGGATSEPIQFTTTGRHVYKCNIHAGMVGGIVEVTAR